MKWYFESCRLSHILLAGIILWTLSASVLFKELAPLAYVGLHLLTTGLFFAAFLSVDRKRQAEPAPAEEQEAPQQVASS